MIIRGWEESHEDKSQIEPRVEAGLALESAPNEEFIVGSQTTSSTYDLYKDLGGKAPKLGGTFGRKPSAEEEHAHHQLAMQIADKRSQGERRLSLIERVRLYFLGY